MKYYKCDLCSNDFDEDDGMTQGQSVFSRKARWQNPDGTVKEIIIEKTMRVLIETPSDKQLTPHKSKMNIDLCRSCVMKFERP